MAKNNGQTTQPVTAPVSAPLQTAIPGTEPAPKVSANSTRDNSGLRWKPRTISALKHLAEKFPVITKEVAAVIAKVETLPDHYVTSEQSFKLAVGDTVRLPEHADMLKQLKQPDVGKVTEYRRGSVVVQVGPHKFTVLSSTVEFVSRP